jgi:hypothetical protein
MSLAVSLTFAPPMVKACGGYGDMATLQPGIVVGDQFVCVTTAGHLVSHDLKKGARRDYTELSPRFLPSIEVADNKACVASKDHVHVIDLESGKMVHSLRHSNGAAVVGFADKDRVFTANHRAVEVFDLASGKRLQRVELCKEETPQKDTGGKTATRGFGPFSWNKEGIVPCCRHEHLLCIALPTIDAQRSGLWMSTLGAVAVIDLREGRKTDEAKVASGITGLAMVGGRLVVRSGIFSYGIPFERCSSFGIRKDKIVDKIVADSKDQRRYDISWVGLEEWRHSSPLIENSGDLFVGSGKNVLRVDAKGKCVAQKEALGPNRQLVGVWNQQALVAEHETLHVVALTPAEKKPATE